MNRIDSNVRYAPGGNTALGSALRIWLLAGLALCLLVPPLRGSSYWLGWLPLWLVVTPLVGALALARDPWREARAFARIFATRSQPAPGSRAPDRRRSARARAGS